MITIFMYCDIYRVQHVSFWVILGQIKVVGTGDLKSYIIILACLSLLFPTAFNPDLPAAPNNIGLLAWLKIEISQIQYLAFF